MVLLEGNAQPYAAPYAALYAALYAAPSSPMDKLLKRDVGWRFLLFYFGHLLNSLFTPYSMVFPPSYLLSFVGAGE
jgi:hypothetical protein